MDVLLPSYTDIIELHEAVLAATGGASGVLNAHYVEAAISRPMVYAQYNEYTIHTVAAIILDSLARSHAFSDGNKRTALTSMIFTYNLNGVVLDYTLLMNEEFEDIVMWVVESKPQIEQIEAVLAKLVSTYAISV
jgi:death-on-curing protein